MSWAGGTFRDGSLARYDPFGNYLTEPATAVKLGTRPQRFAANL